ncbi:MAG: substrate-binding domain-containing protein [Gemmataceae bacterium]|nr:substrate-binding domain-containing protein [Gemmataceae bacterium]
MNAALRGVILVLVALVAAALPACDGRRTSRITIGVVTNCVADFWRICEAGATKAAQDFDVDLQFREPEKAFDASVQMPIIEAWVKQGIHGIAVSVIDPKAQAEDLARIAKKVPLITMDNDAEGSGRLCYIGIDNYEAGKAVGRLLKQALPQGGTLALFIGSTKSANGKARTQGVLDELAGEKDAAGEEMAHPLRPEIRVRRFGQFYLVDGEAKEDNNPDNAQPLASRVLARLKGLPNLCAVGLYAYNPPAILDAARSRSMHKELTIIGFDEDWETLRAIAQGEIRATVVQDPFQYGYQSVAALAAYARGDHSKLVTEPIPYRIVTKDGGPDELVQTPRGALTIKNLPVKDFEARLRADIASVRK